MKFKPLERLKGFALATALALAANLAQAQAPADPYNYTRTTRYTSYPPGDGPKAGLLKSQTIEPDQAPSCVTTTYDYDAYGNKTQTTLANCPGASGRALFDSRRSSTTLAGRTVTVNQAGTATPVQVPEGLFPDSQTNAVGHTETRQYDPRFGVLTQLTGPNQLSTRIEVDDFGRSVQEIRADGTRTLIWTCFVAAGLDRSSNTVIDGQACPSPAANEIPADALLFTHRETRDTQGRKLGSFSRVYSDRLGREIRSVSEGFDGAAQPAERRGALVVRDTRYSAQGQKILHTQPYYLVSGASTLAGSNDQGITRTDYDALGRPLAVYATEPNGSQAAVDFGPYGSRRAARRTFSYTALARTDTDDAGHSRSLETNALGEVIRLTDPSGAQLVHQHDAFGHLVATQDALQNRITLVYDLRGRKLQLADPDAGTTTYCPDALGQLKAQQNAIQRTTPGASATCPDTPDSALTATPVPGWVTLAYDRLGRLSQRADPEYTSTWSHDRYADGSTCPQGLGKLCETRTSHGLTRKRVYDPLGRLVNQRTDLTGGPSFATAQAYDSRTGQLSSQTYPTGLQVAYTYTPLGQLDNLSLATPATLSPLPATPGGNAGASTSLPTGTVLWQAQQANAWGRLEQQSFGNGLTGLTGHTRYEAATGRISTLTTGTGTNGTVLNHQYTWSSQGQLLSRGDANGDGSTGAVSEQFGYDPQDRLTTYTVAAPAIPTLTRSVTLQYNALGMLLYKSDLGNYAYGAQGPGAPRPHALQSITGLQSTSFGYDANGNLQNASAGPYRNIAYTSFNLPDSQNGAQGPGGTPRYQWQYDDNHARIKETRSDASGTRTTWYLHPDNAGGLGFESESSGSTLSHRHYLTTGSGTVGVLISTGPLPSLGATQTAPTPAGSLALNKLEYWHKDHLGSLAATTDHSGTLSARYAYDPFGKRRFTQGTYDAAGTLVIDWSPTVNRGTDRGFTGHEHLDDLGLIHMNGRLYDPTLGRFLQADPRISAAFDLQNYDRYAYVLNNPLASTDPTGLEPNREMWLNDSGDLPRVIITGSNWRDAYTSRGLFTTGDILRNAGMASSSQWGGLRTGPFLAAGAAPGTPAQQSMGRLILAAKEQLDSAARGATALVGALGKNAAENEAAPVLVRLVGAMLAEAAAEEAAAEGLETDGANSTSPQTPPPDGEDPNGKEKVRTDGVERHSGQRLRADGISTEKAEAAVREDIDGRVADGSFRIGGDKSASFRTTVDGKTIEYRAIRLSDGSVNVGTIFPVH